MTTETLAPSAAEPVIAPSGIVLPPVIVDAGPAAVARFLEFFAGRIANKGATPGWLMASRMARSHGGVAGTVGVLTRRAAPATRA